MRMERFEISPYDYGAQFKEKMNDKLAGAVHVHTVQAPYNNNEPILIYAFYPDHDPVLVKENKRLEDRIDTLEEIIKEYRDKGKQNEN